ncbi:MAG TPA: WGR domain-containing protein [Acidiphilium sp.]|nr:MAG: hypothetical protein B7X01_00505 [Acidiphilium sp. 21-62-4]OZB39388.1 MAG: hypothetical protein B7X48_09280 [Acidiphilium sp. 34-60-192]HQT89622.1 WGR domain-containing protein [Acidiphilium sp.]
MSPVSTDSVPNEPAGGGLRRSPRRRPVRVPRPAAVQLPLFPEQVTLTRIRPELNERRFYQIEIMADLFGAVVLARRWGRIGRSCRMRLEPYADFGSALNALATLARRKRQRGYQDQHAI